jgi:hypothetical protein
VPENVRSCRALPLAAPVKNGNDLTMRCVNRLLSTVLTLFPAVLCVAVLNVACSAQTREYDILLEERKIGSEILTANQDGTRLDTKTEVTNSDGNTAKSELEELFSPSGSNKWLLYSVFIEGKKVTMEMAWTGDKVAKMELVDVNGQKSSPERQDDGGMTSSTAMGLDLSVSVYRIAILRALKSGIPAKIGMMTIPVGGQAGVVPVRVEKVAGIQTITIQENRSRLRNTRSQRYRIPDSQPIHQ